MSMFFQRAPISVGLPFVDARCSGIRITMRSIAAPPSTVLGAHAPASLCDELSDELTRT